MPEDRLSGEEAMSRVVESLEEAASALEPMADFYETLDLALREHSDSERASFASFVRAYKKAAQAIEEESERNSGEGA